MNAQVSTRNVLLNFNCRLESHLLTVHRRSKCQAQLDMNLSGIKDRGSGIHALRVSWVALGVQYAQLYLSNLLIFWLCTLAEYFDASLINLKDQLRKV